MNFLLYLHLSYLLNVILALFLGLVMGMIYRSVKDNQKYEEEKMNDD